MRHSTISRSTSKRLQRLTAFLTALAIIAGFLPLGAVTVRADEITKDYYIQFDGDVTVDPEGASIQYKFGNNDEWTTLPDGNIQDTDKDNVKKFTLGLDNTLYDTVANRSLTIKFNLASNPVTSAKVGSDADDNDKASLTAGENNSYTWTYNDFSSDSAKRYFVFIISNLQGQIDTNSTINSENPLTITGDYKINDCTLTIDSTGVLTIENGGNLILDGSVASIVKNDGGTFAPATGAKITFEGGTPIPSFIELHESDGTAITAASFENREVFEFDGSIWKKVDPNGNNPGNDPNNDPQPQNVKLTESTTIDNLTISGEYEVDKCTLTITNNLTITASGNLVLKGNASLVINEGVTFTPETGARLCLADGASKPAAITALYNFEGTDTVTIPNNGWFTFQYDGTKWKLTEKIGRAHV